MMSCDYLMMSSGEWAKLDDDKVSLVKEDQILKLSGGGDWHVAYILLYGPQRLEKMKNDLKEEEKVCCMCELGGLSGWMRERECVCVCVCVCGCVGVCVCVFSGVSEKKGYVSVC